MSESYKIDNVEYLIQLPEQFKNKTPKKLKLNLEHHTTIRID